jgi:hypothetical protein
MMIKAMSYFLAVALTTSALTIKAEGATHADAC